MYIKDIERLDDKVVFHVQPCFSTEALVDRCRRLVDDYFTFIKFDNYTQRYNFRKYCLTPDYDDYNLKSIEISELTYSGSPILITCFRNGDIYISYPENMTGENKFMFAERMERSVRYAL